MDKRKSVIRASEIGEYAYCSRAWWYRHVIKLAPPDSSKQGDKFSRGKEAHAGHGRTVSLAITLRLVGVGLLLCGLMVLAVAAVVGVR